jgi:hypothetical protein
VKSILTMLAVPTLVLIAWGVSAAPLDDLRDCADRVASRRIAEMTLDKQCPGLDAALDALGLKPLLSAEERRRLDGTALRKLAALSLYYAGATPARGPKLASLAVIADQVNGKKTETRSWWDRFTAWVREWLARPEASGKSWFDEWLHRVSESTSLLSAILYICMAIVIAAALAVIITEMRAAGLLGRRKLRFESQSQESTGVPAIAGLTGAGRSGVPQLLNLLVARLIQTRRLQFERTLTHRELVARSVFDTLEQRSTFARVSQAAESQVYGGVSAAVAPQPLIEQANSLLAQLTELPSRQSS